MGANSIKTVGQDAQSVSAPVIVVLDGTALAANEKRLWWGIINLNTAAVLVKMGAGASAISFHVPLKACTAADDGSGGAFFDDTYTGIVTILAAAGSPRVSVIEAIKEF
jgi:hypothetical protein